MSDDSIAKNKADNRTPSEKIDAGDVNALESKKEQYSTAISEAKKEEKGPLTPSQEFDRKLLVDVTQMNTNPYITQLGKIPQEEENKINYFFKGLTQQEFLNAEQNNNSRTGRTKQGTPFKCIVTPSNGTLIITKDTLIHTDNSNEENGSMDATRQNADGSLSKIHLNKRMGMIVSASNYHLNAGFTVEEQMMADSTFEAAGNRARGSQKELEGKTPEERLAFLQTLKALGIKIDDGKNLAEMTDSELSEVKKQYDQENKEVKEGKRDKRSLKGTFTRGNAQKHDGNIVVQALSMDIGIDDTRPETVRSVKSVNGKESMEIYRRTADGKYVETTNFQYEKGKPKYNIYTYEQMAARVGNNLINLEDLLNDCVKMKEFEPKEIQAIARDTERAIKRELEQDREQPEDFMPGMRRQDPRR